MTSRLKCPFCGAELQETFGAYMCRHTGCKICCCVLPTCMIEALIQAKQDLEIATKALEEMQHWLGVIRRSMISHLNNQNNTLLEHYETDPTVQNIDKAKCILKHYIEQIEHKE